MTSRLELYNGALAHLSTIRLADLTENRSERFELDAVYDKVLAGCLASGGWKFAKRTVRLDYDTDVEPVLGKPYTFAFPTDFCRLMGLWENSDLSVEAAFDQEQQQWFCDVPTIYVAYVSNDASYGMDLGAWPPSFTEYVETSLASRSAIPVTKDRGTRNDLIVLTRQNLATAKKYDAIGEAVKQKPVGRLVRSRMGNAATPTFRNGMIRR